MSSEEEDEEKCTAAKSLNLIFGAQLYEIVSIVEKEEADLTIEEIPGKLASNKDDAEETGDERVIVTASPIFFLCI